MNYILIFFHYKSSVICMTVKNIGEIMHMQMIKLRKFDRKEQFISIFRCWNQNTVDSRYLEVEGTLWNTSRYPYFDISDLQNWGKYQSNNQISQMNM